MAVKKLKLHVFNLMDGTTILGDKRIEYSDRIIVKNPLILHKYSGSLEDTEMQILLMRYDNFNLEDSISLNINAIITSYACTGDIIKYYTEFVKESEAVEEDIATEPTPQPKLLTESKTPTAKKIDFDEVRRNTIRVVVNNDDENN